MLAQFCVHLILIFISTPIPLIFGDCITDGEKCFDKFRSDLDNNFKQQFETTHHQLNDICHPIDGSFNKFVDCLKDVDNGCHSDKGFRTVVCEKRHFKTKIYRFLWKASFFYELCHNSSPEWSQDFLKHEDCINSVFNTRKWKCDTNYERVVKSKKDWKTDLNGTCSLWQKFRDCSKRDIHQKCGNEASLISDHLFHNHQSYFEKYYSCNFTMNNLGDQCWLDLIKAKDTNTPTPISSATHPTNDMTDNNIDSNKSLLTTDDNSGHTQSSDTDTNAQTLKDTTDSDFEVNHQNEDISHPWLRVNGSEEHDLDGQESNQLVVGKESHEVKSSPMKESNGKNTGQLTLTSGASTDPLIADKYLLLLPIFIIFLIKLLI